MVRGNGRWLKAEYLTCYAGVRILKIINWCKSNTSLFISVWWGVWCTNAYTLSLLEIGWHRGKENKSETQVTSIAMRPMRARCHIRNFPPKCETELHQNEPQEETSHPHPSTCFLTLGFNFLKHFKLILLSVIFFFFFAFDTHSLQWINLH